MGNDTKIWYVNVKEILSVVGTLGLGAGYLWWLFHQDGLDEAENERRRKERENSFLFKAKRKVNRTLIERFHLDD